MTAGRRLSELAIGLIPILLLLGLWQYLTAFKIAPPTLLPPPGTVFARVFHLLGDPTFLGHAATTLYRLFWGFGLAVVVGVSLGIAAVGSPLIGAILRPLVRVLAPVPKIALYPVFILTLGFDHSPRSRWCSPMRCSRSCLQPIRARSRSSRSWSGRRAPWG
jgi:ABC-type nitrate/sulfonate/bicarbonate transport system permease component